MHEHKTECKIPLATDGICAWPETANTCPSDCGSYEVSVYTNQRAKDIDEACAFNGNGLADQCAAANRLAGRFNELQAALDSLEGGDTLYIHPGDYWRPVTRQVRDPYGIYEKAQVATGTLPTAQRLIIITSRYNDDPATNCLSLGTGGSEIGAYGITECVGRNCR